MTADMKVQDVPQYEHFDDEEYPESSSYFMYGDKKDAFLFHIPTKNPDFLQVIILMNELAHANFWLPFDTSGTRVYLN